MEYKYYRELKHNYLVFEDGREGEYSRYQQKIAQSGRIKQLVPCAERNINGNRYLYYEINSMQTLKDRFSVNGMNAEQLKELLVSAKELLEGLSEFLMGEDGIVFNIRNIYTDLSTGEFKFIYCPFFDEAMSFSEFTMELLDIVDEGDKEATELVYRLCEQSASIGDFVYDVLNSTLLDEKEEKPEREHVSAIKPKAAFETVKEPDPDIEDDLYDEDSEPSSNNRLKRAGNRLGGKIQLLLSLLFFVVVGGMVYVRMNYILSNQENLLSIIVMLISAITGVVALLGGFREMKKSRGTEVKEVKKSQPFDEDECLDDDSFYSEDDYDLEKEDTFKRPVRVTGSFPKINAEDCGETVVLDARDNNEMALFSRNLDKTVRIALDKLPLTVGKMEGCVDKVLSDSSISRIHCRFVSDGDRVAVIDLGSTNGSYRNGIRLTPQKKTYIEEGDEIRLGRVCFDCR